LQENRRAGIDQPPSTINTHTPILAVEESPVTVCEAPVLEIGPEEAETQHSVCYGSSRESYDISESLRLSVTPQTCCESEALRLMEE
jgi:hypothetical protein